MKLPRAAHIPHILAAPLWHLKIALFPFRGMILGFTSLPSTRKTYLGSIAPWTTVNSICFVKRWCNRVLDSDIQNSLCAVVPISPFPTFPYFLGKMLHTLHILSFSLHLFLIKITNLPNSLDIIIFIWKHLAHQEPWPSDIHSLWPLKIFQDLFN